MVTPGALKVLITARLRARQAREREQGQLLDAETDWHGQIQQKLQGLWDTQQFWNFTRCGNEDFFRTCKECGRVEKKPYACCLKFCPRCQFRVTATRRRLLEFWTSKISQPKHLVLTQTNFPILTRRKIKMHTRACAALRRARCFEKVLGGCRSTEITNEGRGWHLHSHWLLDVRWLDMPAVARSWGKLVGQEFAICKVKDVREKQFLQEITKYVVKGCDLATWPAEHLLEFVTAIRGLRFFSSFGSLAFAAPAIRREIAAAKAPTEPCPCGSTAFVYEDEQDAVLHEILSADRRNRRK
jgi:hypothetical protein